MYRLTVTIQSTSRGAIIKTFITLPFLLLLSCGPPKPEPELVAEKSIAFKGTTSEKKSQKEELQLEMNNEKLDELIHESSTKIEGEKGLWRFEVEGRLVVIVTDTKANRMRIISPIVKTETLTPVLMEAMMEANFHTALDARFATSSGVLYSAFIHPLSSLTEKDFRSGLRQVVHLAKSYGTTFSSGELQFR